MNFWFCLVFRRAIELKPTDQFSASA